MHNLEGAIDNIQNRLSKLDKIWPKKGYKEEFKPKKILCFVDANYHSNDAIDIAQQISKEYDIDFVIRSLFDNELLKFTGDEFINLKTQIIDLVKTKTQDAETSHTVTFIEGDAIKSVKDQLSMQYDMIILPVPYQSNLSNNPDAVALDSLAEYLISNLKNPLIIVPDLENAHFDLFSSILVVTDDFQNINQNIGVLNTIFVERSKVDFAFLLQENVIDDLAEASKGIVDSGLVKERLTSLIHDYATQLKKIFEEEASEISYFIISHTFEEQLLGRINEIEASMLVMILPPDKLGFDYLLLKELMRKRSIRIPTLILRLYEEEPEEEKPEENKEDEPELSGVAEKNSKITESDDQESQNKEGANEQDSENKNFIKSGGDQDRGITEENPPDNKK